MIDEDAEVPSIPALYPRYKYEEVTDHTPEVWDDAEARGLDAAIEDVSNQNLIWTILICALLLSYAYYREQ